MAMPSVFVTHGGGPMPLMGDKGQATLTSFLKGAHKLWPKPKAIVVATAHWEEKVTTVSTAAKPSMLYDYYGFPPEAYTIKYDAPGSPELAQKVLDLLKQANIPHKADSQRGFDHGTFVPLKLMYPDADIPIVQMSVISSLDPQAHLDVGKALAPLRDEGVLILASGSSYHNMRSFRTAMQGGSTAPTVIGQDFDQWLQTTLTQKSPEERAELLRHWAQAPGGKDAHPREEHLIPLMVAVGAAGTDVGKTIYNGKMLSVACSSFAFGL